MADQRAQQNQGKNQDGQAKRHPRKQWQKKQQERVAKKRDPEEIPILKYRPANNFSKFKEAMSKAALKNYGQLGKLIKLGDYFVPEEPFSTDYDLVNDPIGINKATYLEDMKEYHRSWPKCVVKDLSCMPLSYNISVKRVSAKSSVQTSGTTLTGKQTH